MSASPYSWLKNPKTVVIVGDIIHTVWKAILSCDNTCVTREVVLTGERRKHYLQSHPEMTDYEAELALTILQPLEIHLDKRDSRIYHFYRQSEDSKWLRVALWLSDKRGLSNSVHSFRLASDKEIAKGSQLWKRK